MKDTSWTISKFLSVLEAQCASLSLSHSVYLLYKVPFVHIQRQLMTVTIDSLLPGDASVYPYNKGPCISILVITRVYSNHTKPCAASIHLRLLP